MQMILQEAKKLLIYQKVLLWFFLFIGLKLFSVSYVAINTEMNLPEGYSAYFKILGGRVTKTKIQYIEQKYQSLSVIPKEINKLEEAYQNGEINRIEYLDKLVKFSKIKQEEACIKLFYNKYMYAEENLNKRYIVQDTAWEELLTKEYLDWLLIIFLFVMTVPVFCEEYQSEMHLLQICSVRKGAVPVAKILLVTGLAVLATFFFGVIEYYVYTKYLGGEYPYAPIQSLEFFEESILPFSFLELRVCLTVCKMFGAMLLVLIIMAVSIMVKKSLLAMLGSILTVIIPAAISNVPKVKYLLPCPAGLLYAVGYFYPNLYDYQLSEEIDVVEKVVSFVAFERKELVRIGMIFLILLLLFIFFIIISYQKKRLLNVFLITDKRKKEKGISVVLPFYIKICMIILLLLLLLGLSSCGGKKQYIEETFYENSCNANGQMNTKYHFTVEDNNILIYNLKTKEETYLFRDVFLQQEKTENCTLSIYTTEDYLYYGKDYDNEFQVYKVNLSDFSSKCIYQYTYNHNYMYSSYDLMLVTQHAFFVNDAINQVCYCIDRRDKNWKEIKTVGGLYAVNYGNIIYYENMESHVVSYNVLTGKETVYSDIFLRSQFSVKSSSFYIYGDLCFYTNMLDKDNIYCYQFSTGENQFFLCKNKINSFWCDYYFFYYVESDGKLLEIDIKNKEKKILWELDENEVECSMDGKHIYQLNLKGEWEFIK